VTDRRYELGLAATSSQFVPESLSAPRNTPLRITFRNSSSEPHTLIFPEPIAVNPGEVVGAGQTFVVDLTIPSAGDYTFLCNVHEGMTGILRVN
jgi:plastocyanin